MEAEGNFLLPESELPREWYNIVAEMKTKPQKMRNPENGEPHQGRGLIPYFQ